MIRTPRFAAVASFFAACCAALLGFTALVSCRAYDLGEGTTDTLEVDTKNPNWSQDAQRILERRCDNCHGTGETPFAPGAVAPYKVGFSAMGETAFKAKWAALSLSYVNSSTEPMPPTYADPLSANERTALVTYLKAAVASASANTLAGCTATRTTLTFARDIKPITQASCEVCHQGAAPAGNGVALETAAQFKAHRVAAIEYLTGKRDTVMPPGRPEFAQSDNGKKLIEWLCASSEVK